MAHTVKIVTIDQGGTTVEVVSFGGYLLHYVMKSLTAVELEQNPHATLIEEMEFDLDKTTVAALETDIRAIQAAFAEARRFQLYRAGNRVYLQVQRDGSATLFQSEIVDGSVLHPEEDLGAGWAVKNLTPTLRIERVAWWEKATADQLLIEGSTSAFTIQNSDDSATENNFTITVNAGAIDAAIPTPIQLEFINNTGSSRRYSRIFYGGYDTRESAGLVNMFEIESATGSPTSTSNSTYSNDAYCLFTALDYTTASLIYWTISNANLAYYLGRYYRAILVEAPALSSSTGAFFAQVVVRSSSGTPIWAGEKIRLRRSREHCLHDLGIVQIPPYSAHVTNDFQGIQLGLYLWALSTTNIALDFLSLMPTDGYGFIRTREDTIATTDKILIDGMKDDVYGLDISVSEVAGGYTHKGSYLIKRPGFDLEAYLLWEYYTGSAYLSPANDTAQVRAFWKPRVLTI